MYVCLALSSAAYILANLQVSLAKGQGERMKKLKRKVSWHTDQLRQEKARVASIERDLTSTNQELEELRTQVTQLQRVCSTPAVGMTSSLQLQAFGKHEPQPVLQQENQVNSDVADIQSKVTYHWTSSVV